MRAVGAAIAATVAVAVVAFAGRAPLSGAVPVNASSAQAPAVALVLLFAGAGIVALASVVGSVFARRRRRPDDEPQPGPRRVVVSWPWKLAVIVLTLALASALIGAALLGTRPLHPRAGLGPGGVSGRAGAGVSGGARGGGFVLPAWMPWTGLAIAGVALAGAGWWVGRRRAAQAGDEPRPETAAGAAVDAAISALSTSSDPRSAVIVAYAAMERTLGEHGIVRPRAEAPREYLRRVLAATPGAESYARTLTALFEQARFSTHPISEHVRDRAADALNSLRAGVGQAAEGG